MSIEGQKIYPGQAATPMQILVLADEYRRAANALSAAGRRGQPLSWAPYRLVAIHAVELYLNAFLLTVGHSPEQVRSFQHNFVLRMQHARAAKLNLRKRTADHLQNLSTNREYLVSRYDPSACAISQINRLDATLTQVAAKVTEFVGRADKQTQPRPSQQ